MTKTFTSVANHVLAVADLLCGNYKQSHYDTVILGFTRRQRLKCVLELIKEAVLAEHDKREVTGVFPDRCQSYWQGRG